MKRVETVNNALFEAFNAVATDGMGYVVYVFDRDEGSGTGFNSKGFDAGDAMVLIHRLAERYGIDLGVLSVVLASEKTENGQNGEG
jgi:hypothetical protein